MLIRQREPLVKHCIGFVDGLHLVIQNSADHVTQNSHYNGWLATATISCVLMFTPTGRICWAAINYPGSWHDANVSHGLITRLLDPQKTPDLFFVAADSAFPHSGVLRTKIKTPLNKQTEPSATSEQKKYSAALTSIRQMAEWGMRGLRSKFPRLHCPLTSDDSNRLLLIKTAIYVYNLKVSHIGLSQIRSVFAQEE
jgi:hypothetical protein